MEVTKTKSAISVPFIFLLFLTVFSPLEAQQQSPIKTMVVLVMENRSFDHMIGWMKKSINPSINGVIGDECNLISTKIPNPYSICFTDGVEFVDPDHSFEAVEQQVFGSTPFPSMSGFVEQALLISPNLSETIMKGFRPDAVLVYAYLMK
ncbi:hypothetical protein V6N11_018638 [Hibiscus sabdariffa]|uniref:Uncharacterized protein n=2 Tax=Hibiscus sabdariffa TaxID=183260 RepID=A0ABR2QSW8_9ROSI